MKRKSDETKKLEYRRSPACSPEARENQLIALAEKRAEEQLRNGTASSQVICHYLKLGSTRERLEREKLQSEVDMLIAKKNALESAQRVEELYSEAMKAVRLYRGEREDDE